ncbi:hypothetical protein HY629_00745 [Candidatus Uhrbacteria bacterium]|nr:hypothetical protein [Candidatus Uhrbacteria bacterium]
MDPLPPQNPGQPTPAQKSAAVTVGLGLLVALTAYVGAATAPTATYAGEFIPEYRDECDPRHPDWANTWSKKYGENDWPDAYRLFQSVCNARRSNPIQEIRDQLNNLTQLAGRIKYLKDIDVASIQTQIAAIRSDLEALRISVTDARNAINDLLSLQGQSLVSYVEKLDAAGLDAAFARVSEYDGARNAFYDAKFWERVNELSAPIEVREQIKNTEKDMKYLKKKSFLKKVAFIKKILKSFSDEPLNDRLTEWDEAVADVKAALQENDYEEARELMNDLSQNGNPGDIRWFVDRLYRQLKDIDSGLEVLIEEVGIDATLKDKLRTIILGLFEPIVRYWNAGKNMQVIQQIFNRVEEQLREFGEELRASIEKQLEKTNRFRVDVLQKDLSKDLKDLKKELEQQLKKGGEGTVPQAPEEQKPAEAPAG